MPRAVSIVLSLLGVLVCGTIGGVAAWALVTWIGLSGVPGSLLAAVVGMAIALAAWIGVTTVVHRALRRR